MIRPVRRRTTIAPGANAAAYAAPTLTGSGYWPRPFFSFPYPAPYWSAAAPPPFIGPPGPLRVAKVKRRGKPSVLLGAFTPNAAAFTPTPPPIRVPRVVRRSRPSVILTAFPPLAASLSPVQPPLGLRVARVARRSRPGILLTEFAPLTASLPRPNPPPSLYVPWVARRGKASVAFGALTAGNLFLGTRTVIVASVPLPVATGPIVQDAVAMLDIESRLLATNLFGKVVVGARPSTEPIDAADNPAVWVDRVGWNEADRVDQYSPERLTRFSVWLRVADEDYSRRWQLLSELEHAVQNAIEGQSLGAFTWPALTKFTGGNDDPSVKPPQRQVVMTGQFSYAPTADYGNRDATQPALN
jgi:hypothetical protein